MALSVFGLHVALVLLFGLSGRMTASRPTAPAPPRSTVRFVAVAPSPASDDRAANASVPATAPGVAARRGRSGSPARPSGAIDVIGAPAANSPTPASTGATVAPVAITPPAPAAASSPFDGRSLLDGQATRRAIRESALAPRREVQPNVVPTPEARMTQTLGGDGRRIEQDLGNGRRRFWLNGKCTESTEARASALFPEDTLPRPRVVGACP